MPSKIRLKRIGDRIREELASMLVKEIQDPRLLGVMVTDVTVDRELAYAEVFVSAVEGNERSTEVLNGMQHAGTFLRAALSQRIDLRVFPRLRFHWDPTPERADRFERLLHSLKQEEQAAEPADETEDEADE